MVDPVSYVKCDHCNERLPVYSTAAYSYVKQEPTKHTFTFIRDAAEHILDCPKRQCKSFFGAPFYTGDTKPLVCQMQGKHSQHMYSMATPPGPGAYMLNVTWYDR